MFFQRELLGSRKNQKGPLPKCWLAATLTEKQFSKKCYSTKSDKDEIHNIDIPALW